MMLTGVTLSLGGCASFIAGCFGFKILKTCTDSKPEESDRPTIRLEPTYCANLCGEDELLVFPDTHDLCYSAYEKITGIRWYHQCPGQRCEFLHEKDPSGLKKLLQYLSRASHSIDVCVYSFTHQGLAKTLRLLKEKRSIKVRIIAHTDNKEGDHKNNQIPELRKAGLEVRLRTEQEESSSWGLMHNKFVIIDSEIVINGSFNWTASAVRYNDENLVVTRNKIMVNRLARLFESLWRRMVFSRSKQSQNVEKNPVVEHGGLSG